MKRRSVFGAMLAAVVAPVGACPAKGDHGPRWHEKPPTDEEWTWLGRHDGCDLWCAPCHDNPESLQALAYFGKGEWDFEHVVIDHHAEAYGHGWQREAYRRAVAKGLAKCE